MRKIKVAFANMWGQAGAFGADYLPHCFPCLRGHYEFSIAAAGRPDFAFYSVYGYVKDRFPGSTRLVYAGEPGDHFAQGAKISNGVSEEGFYHFGLTCAVEQTSPDHCYMPQGLLHLNLYNRGVETLLRDGSEPPRKEFFCNFIYSNGASLDRIEFLKKLENYQRVESCGQVLRNNNALAGAAYSRDGYLKKQAFQARCKFSIAMENNYFPGYNTEKITDAFVARSVPIYRGDPRIAEVFNPAAFINLDDFDSEEAAIEWIARVDQDDGLYRSYIESPPFIWNKVPDRFTDHHYLSFWKRVLEA